MLGLLFNAVVTSMVDQFGRVYKDYVPRVQIFVNVHGVFFLRPILSISRIDVDPSLHARRVETMVDGLPRVPRWWFDAFANLHNTTMLQDVWEP